MKLCAACLSAPQGVEGHPDLRLDIFRADGEKWAVFICEACRTMWRRTYSVSGEFQWQRVEASGPHAG